jgi:hypothetical protein
LDAGSPVRVCVMMPVRHRSRVGVSKQTSYSKFVCVSTPNEKS